MIYTAVYKKCGDWWAAWIEEIPSVNTQGRTRANARHNLHCALAFVLSNNMMHKKIGKYHRLKIGK